MKIFSPALAFFLAASLAGAAVAQEAQTAKNAAATQPAQAGTNAPATSTDGTNTNNPVRVRASHRVEVIAPGEHVETIIDRMRASTAAGSTSKPADPATTTERLQVRPPDSQRATDRGAGNQQRNGSHGNAPGGPPSGPANSNNGPPPERR